MAGERVKLIVNERERLGTAETRRLRRQGLIPGVLYGRSKPVAISVPRRELRQAMTGAGGLHAILDVVVEGKQASHSAILKDYQQDKVRGYITHIDLMEVRLDQPIQASVVVQLHGGDESPGVREGGVLSQVAREINVEALPLEVPEHVELDVSGMELGDTLRLGDLGAYEGVTFLDDPETVLATVTLPTREVEPEEEAVAEGEAAEGAEGAEGEQAPEGGSEAPAEPTADAAGAPGTTEG
jgi:large subunit ribosomal protein L25